MENRMLSQVLDEAGYQTGSQRETGTQRETTTTTQFGKSFNTFLTVFSINLAHRFPDISDLNTISYNNVRKIADFSAACSQIALETWEELTLGSSRQAERLSRQQQRVA